MRIAVVGAKGMLGQDLVAACRQSGVDVVAFDLPELDTTRDNGGRVLKKS